MDFQVETSICLVKLKGKTKAMRGKDSELKGKFQEVLIAHKLQIIEAVIPN